MGKEYISDKARRHGEGSFSNINPEVKYLNPRDIENGLFSQNNCFQQNLHERAMQRIDEDSDTHPYLETIDNL